VVCEGLGEDEKIKLRSGQRGEHREVSGIRGLCGI
jgi:hypothetical protein